jgi:YesN/AraC family two-component response regulator
MNRNIHLLLVEDDQSLGCVIKELLEIKNYRVTWFQNGMDALSFLTCNYVDLIITDIKMPVMSGDELKKEMELYNISISTPILFITGLFIQELDETITSNYPVLIKPFSLHALVDKVSELLFSNPMNENELPLTLDEEKFKSNFMYWMGVLYKHPNVIDQLVDKLKLSKYEIERRVLELMQMNLRTFVLSYRIKKSIELINNGHLNVTEIAKQCGFGSVNAFTEVFKKFTGLTPKKFILKNT